MSIFHPILIAALLLESIILLASYFLTGGISGMFLFIGAVLPLAIIPVFVRALRASVKQTRKPVKDTTTKINDVLEIIDEGIIIIDGRGVVRSLNGVAANLFGYLPAEVEGNDLSMLIPNFGYKSPENSVDIFLKNIGDATNNKSLAVKGRHSAGDTFDLTLSARKITFAYEPVFILTLRDKLEIEKREKIKDEFVSTFSHEIRTPLTSILGALGIVSGGMAGEIPEEARKIIDIAHRNCQGLISLVNNILDLSRLESDIHEFRLKPVRLVPILKQTVEDLQPYADQYKVKFRLKEGDKEVIVMGREEQLKQVMTNLMSNAAKFSPAGNTVEVSLECLDGTVRVSVTDHGPGVPEEFRRRIFQKFAQADSSDRRNRGGTGLGLNISKKIIEKFGGHIDYDSVLESETTFYFELPEVVREEAPFMEITFDEETNLLARTGFDRELNKEWRRGGRARNHLSLIFLELDDLQMYEEMYGTGARVESMKRIANAVSGTLKRAGDLVARYSDDALAILLADTDLKGSGFVAEKIRSNINVLRIEFVLPNRIGHITVSQGIASAVPERMTTPEQFIDTAQKALREAQTAGGDMVRYYK